MKKLQELLFIPKSNVKKGSVNLKELLTVKSVVPTFDLRYDSDKDKFTIDKRFIESQTDHQGWTAATDDTGNVYLVQTDTESSEKALQPKFLKTTNNNQFRSSFLKALLANLLTPEVSTYFDLKPVDLDDSGSKIKVYEITAKE